MSKLLKWGVIIFIAFYVLSDPSGAAGTAHGLLNDLQGAGQSLATFVNSFGSK